MATKTKTQTITLKNSFHRTETTVRVRLWQHLGATTIRRLRGLCTSRGCQCGGVCGDQDDDALAWLDSIDNAWNETPEGDYL